MDDIWTYFVALPDGIAEMVTPCADGYTVYINEKLGWEQRIAAFRHALSHIEHMDFEKANIQEIESSAHEGGDYA